MTQTYRKPKPNNDDPTNIILPAPPKIKSLDYRIRGRRIAEALEKRKAAVEGNIVIGEVEEQRLTQNEIEQVEAVKETLRNNVVETAVVTSVVEPTSTMEFITKVSQAAKEYLKDNTTVVFKPNPGPQTEFLAATEKEVFYGGARGGGKTYSLLVDPLRYCSNPSHRGLFIRRTMPELRDVIHHTQRIYKLAFPDARWNEQDKMWRFPSGARIEFGYCEHPTDSLRYLGQAFSWIGIDELPQFPEKQILNDLRGSLRTTDSSLPTYLRGTGNPGGAGNSWIKEEFVDPAPPNTRFEVKFKLPDGTERSITRRFIPAKVWDNPYLLHNDDYVTMLASLPEVQRRQWLEGDWDAFDGAAFPEFRRSIHVIPSDFKIPLTWQRFRAADYGYTAPACCLWLAVDYDNNIYVYRELYGKGMQADTFAREIMLKEKDDNIRYGVIDSSLWAKRGDIGPSIIETMMQAGVRWIPSDRSPGSRKAGKMQIHQRLAINPLTNKPSLFILDNCTNIIKQLSSLIVDENDTEDVDTDLEDHAYDALRYGLMTRMMRTSLITDIFGSRVSAIRSNYKPPADTLFGY